MASGTEATQKGPSVAWYIVPILFGIIGGLVMYFAIRHRDPKMAQKGFLVGILILIANIVLGAVIVFFAPEFLLDEQVTAGSLP